MNARVLILGGTGRIGQSVARDLVRYTPAEVVVTGRTPRSIELAPKMEFLSLDLEDREGLEKAVRDSSLVIHCAGPFHYRDERVLTTCIANGVNYIDVSDHRSFYQKLQPYKREAEKAGITAILNTGIFPGISNSLTREGVEKFDSVDTIRLYYGVGGSGGAGLTVLRTTFLGLQQPFKAWLGGRWQEVKPYTEREVIDFPAPVGRTGVYWFDMPETYTFAESFQVKNAITKFGSIPDFYNHLTWITAHVFPSSWVRSKGGIEFFSKVSYRMTKVTDRFTGIGVAMRAEIEGIKACQKAVYRAAMVHDNTAEAAGCGTGSVAELLLAGRISHPGVYPVEQVLPTDLFLETMDRRGIKIDRALS